MGGEEGGGLSESVRIVRVSQAVGDISALICGCGDSDAPWRELLRILRLRALDSWQPPTSDAEWLMVNLLDGLGLLEHGSSLNGAWLTEAGESALAFLEEFGADWCSRDDAAFVTPDEVWIGGNIKCAPDLEGTE